MKRRVSFVSCLPFVAFVVASLPAIAFAQQSGEEEPASLPPPAAAPAPAPAPAPSAPAVVHAAADADTSLAERREEPAEGPPRLDFVRINAGPKIAYVAERGYDAFSSNDVFPMFSLDATYPLLASVKVVVAAGLGWEPGGSKAETRRIAMRLATHRFAVPIEARYHLGTGLFVFGKIAPGVRAHFVDVEDPSSLTTLTDTAWAFSADLSAGASILLGPRARPDKRRARFWLTPEVGYAFAQAATLRPNPNRDADDVLGADSATNLRSLALQGFFWRASLGVTF
jgi:hypothetical protein